MLNFIITLLATIFVFGLIIFVHELGHYCMARAFKVGIKEFSLGMGPRLKVWKGKYNDFSIKAFPVGGSVSMVGEMNEEDEPNPLKNGLRDKKIWQRICVLAAGPVMNLILGFVLMSIVVVSSAIPSTTIGEFDEKATSNTYGLQAGDTIIAINGDKIRVYNQMAFIIAFDGKEPLDILVMRDGEEVLVEGVVFPVSTDESLAFGTIDFSIYAVKKTFGTVVYQSFYQSLALVETSLKSWVYIIRGDFGFNAVSGPIGVGEQLGEAIEASRTVGDAISNLLAIASFLSFAVFIFNLLPIPVLDGGHILFCIIEKIRGKPLNPKYEQIIMAVFMVMLFGLIIVIALKDILNLF